MPKNLKDKDNKIRNSTLSKFIKPSESILHYQHLNKIPSISVHYLNFFLVFCILLIITLMLVITDTLLVSHVIKDLLIALSFLIPILIIIMGVLIFIQTKVIEYELCGTKDRLICAQKVLKKEGFLGQLGIKYNFHHRCKEIMYHNISSISIIHNRDKNFILRGISSFILSIVLVILLLFAFYNDPITNQMNINRVDVLSLGFIFMTITIAFIGLLSGMYVGYCIKMKISTLDEDMFINFYGRDRNKNAENLSLFLNEQKNQNR